MHNSGLRTDGFAKISRFALAGLLAAFLILAAAASAGAEWFQLSELLLGAVMAAAVIFAAAFAGRLPEKTTAIVCVLLCVLLRLFWVLCTKMEMSYDFARYYNTAYSLAKGIPVPEQAYQAMFPHVLGYPAVLSLVFRVFGPSLGAAQALNIVLDAGSCLLLFYLGSKHFGKRAGTAAALLFAINPTAIMHMPISCSEPLYMLLMLTAIALYERLAGSREGGLKALPGWVLLGVATGLFNAARPLGPILLIAFCACHLVFGKLGFLKKLLPLALMAAAYLLTCSIYFIWAERVLERPVAGGSAGWNLYIGMNTRTQGMWSKGDFASVDGKLEKGESAPEIQADFMRMAGERVKENFESGEIWGLIASKFQNMWGRDNAMLYWTSALEDRSVPPARGDFKLDIEHWSGLLNTVCNAFWWALLLLCVPAAYFMFSRPTPPGIVLTCTVIMIGIVLAFLALEANSRYHYPADALLALAAGWGCKELLEVFGWGKAPPASGKAKRKRHSGS